MLASMARRCGRISPLPSSENSPNQATRVEPLQNDYRNTLNGYGIKGEHFFLPLASLLDKPFSTCTRNTRSSAADTPAPLSQQQAPSRHVLPDSISSHSEWPNRMCEGDMASESEGAILLNRGEHFVLLKRSGYLPRDASHESIVLPYCH